MLARGLPASLSSVALCKTELAEAFGKLGDRGEHRCWFRIDTASEPMRRHFVERLTFFQTTMNDNMVASEGGRGSSAGAASMP